MSPAVTFAALLPALLVAHTVGDHWVQTDHQAGTKGQKGWPGRAACAAHVATYTMTTAATVGMLWWLFGLPISPLGFVAGQLVSAVTHYWADRRSTLARLCEWLGKDGFYRLGQPRLALLAHTDDGKLVRLQHPARAHAAVQEPWDNRSLGTGAYALDQSWHHGWLLIAALVTVLL